MLIIYWVAVFREIFHMPNNLAEYFANSLNSLNCCFTTTLWFLAHKKVSSKTDKSHIFKMDTKEELCGILTT